MLYKLIGSLAYRPLYTVGVEYSSGIDDTTKLESQYRATKSMMKIAASSFRIKHLVALSIEYFKNNF